jgi:DmsE family decaheme c-type cytochrome
LGLAATLWAGQDPPAADKAKPAEEKKSEYAGSEACAVCHEDISKGLLSNRHAAVDKGVRKGWAGRACEGCHGPGAKHAESADANDIKNPAKIGTAADISCLTCHRNQETHVGRIGSGHTRNGVACTACHTVHKPAERVAVPMTVKNKNTEATAVCIACHAPVWAEFQRPHAHKLSTGAMSCLDCHNPHGTLRARMLRNVEGNEPSCVRCHSDKRGPFLYEHAPMRLEGCPACHQPHGSANPRMLNRQEVMLTCLECHANVISPTPAMGGIPPAIHNFANPKYRQCTICHQKVHGSNVNRTLFR